MKIVCIGDSITQGFGVFPFETWVELMNETKKAKFINKGINGDTTRGMLERFGRDVIDEKPDKVIIIGGANDLMLMRDLDAIKSNMMTMVNQAKKNGIAPIIGTYLKIEEEIFDRYRDWIVEYCSASDVGCIDFYSLFDQQKQHGYNYYLFDGIHPNREGYKLMAKIVHQYCFT